MTSRSFFDFIPTCWSQSIKDCFAISFALFSIYGQNEIFSGNLGGIQTSYCNCTGGGLAFTFSSCILTDSVRLTNVSSNSQFSYQFLRLILLCDISSIDYRFASVTSLIGLMSVQDNSRRLEAFVFGFLSQPFSRRGVKLSSIKKFRDVIECLGYPCWLWKRLYSAL